MVSGAYFIVWMEQNMKHIIKLLNSERKDTERCKDKETVRQIGRQAEKETDIQTDKHERKEELQG